MKSHTLNISIQCDPQKIYRYVSNLENLAKWAKTFCRSIARSKNEWVIETPQGLVKIRITQKNDYGVLDHFISASGGEEIFVPMRVVPNSQGSEVIFTVFQQPKMTDEQYFRDIGLVEQDLKTLKKVLEVER